MHIATYAHRYLNPGMYDHIQCRSLPTPGAESVGWKVRWRSCVIMCALSDTPSPTRPLSNTGLAPTAHHRSCTAIIAATGVTARCHDPPSTHANLLKMQLGITSTTSSTPLSLSLSLSLSLPNTNSAPSRAHQIACSSWSFLCRQ